VLCLPSRRLFSKQHGVIVARALVPIKVAIVNYKELRAVFIVIASIAVR
jgi:hypothetical protein